MTGGPVLVGYGPEDRGRGGLELARLLAESAGRSVLVVCVIPDRWGAAGMGRGVDGDYQSYLEGLAREAVEHASAVLADCSVAVESRVVTARSAPAGLSQVAQESDAWLLVTGASADGPWGHIALGSTTDRMVHSSAVPVALALRGLRYGDATRVGRVTAAVDGSPSSHGVLERAADLAAQVGAPLRVVSFAVRAGTMYPPEAGLHAEDRVVQQWREQAQAMIRADVERLPAARNCEPELQVSDGHSWREALAKAGWVGGELLVVGSSASEPRMARVFLGSTATRIVRHAPVPVVVVP